MSKCRRQHAHFESHQKGREKETRPFCSIPSDHSTAIIVIPVPMLRRNDDCHAECGKKSTFLENEWMSRVEGGQKFMEDISRRTQRIILDLNVQVVDCTSNCTSSSRPCTLAPVHSVGHRKDLKRNCTMRLKVTVIIVQNYLRYLF